MHTSPNPSRRHLPVAAPRGEDRRHRGEARAFHAETGADVLTAGDGGTAQGQDGGS